MRIVGEHIWKNEVKVWAAPIAFEDWSAQVCQCAPADDSILREFYAAQWDAADCREFMSLNKMFKHPPRKRQVILGVAAIEKRFALCLWRECSKLLTRRMTPEGRVLVCDTQARMEQAAGIEIVGKVRAGD